MNNILNLSATQTKTATALPELLRVSKRNPCQICGKPDGCSIAADGSKALCMRIPSEKLAKNGDYVHYLDHSTSQKAPPVKKVEIAPAVPKASTEQHHAVYKSLLGALKLSEHHHQNLVERGLSKAAVAANSYKSLHHFEAAVDKISSEFDLAGVAGFYQKNGRWLLNLSSKGAGFFVPSRNECGEIDGLQIRTDKGTPRYFWLSSKDKEQGAGSGTPFHFVNVEKAKASGRILITEGALKADLIAHFTGEAVMAVAGVKSCSGLAERLENLGIETALIAFDSDFITNDHVLRAINNLGMALMAAGIKSSVLVWQKDKGKGLDDFLASHHTLAEAQEISFLDWRDRFEPPHSTFKIADANQFSDELDGCLLYTSPSPRDS